METPKTEIPELLAIRRELEMGERSAIFKAVHVIFRAKVPMIKENQFLGLANAAKNGCLISRLLKIDVSMDATVDSSEPTLPLAVRGQESAPRPR